MPLHRRADIVAAAGDGQVFGEGEVHGERVGVVEYWSDGGLGQVEMTFSDLIECSNASVT